MTVVEREGASELNKLIDLARSLSEKHLSNVLRFQDRDPFGLPKTDIYKHHSTPYERFSPGYKYTKNGELHLIYGCDKEITPEILVNQWSRALEDIDPPEEHYYRPPEVDVYHKGKKVDDSSLEWFFAEPGELTYELREGEVVPGTEPLEQYEQETVHEHNQDLEYWIIRFKNQGLLPEDFDLDKARLYVYLHDLGEAIRGDHAALKGKKTVEQIEQEQEDFITLIESEVDEIINEQTAEELIKAYHDYEKRVDLEAAVVLVVDRFGGNVAQVHSEMNLGLHTLQFSLARFEKALKEFEEHIPDNFSLEEFRQELLRYLLPSENWIRFYNANPSIHEPETIVF